MGGSVFVAYEGSGLGSWSGLASLASTAARTYTWSPQMIGVLAPLPGRLTFHCRFSVALQVVGGLLLLWIAVKLVRQTEGESEGAVRQGTTLAEAVWIIIVADVVMSLDNVIAVAGAAQGDMWLVVFGIGLSMPLPVSGRAGANVAAAEARRRQAETAVLVAQRNMEREVITVTHRLAAKLAESAKWTPDAARRFREAAELADRHYRLGAVPISTYVELQNSYLEAIEALYETQQEALEAAGTLQLLTGLELNAVEAQP